MHFGILFRLHFDRPKPINIHAHRARKQTTKSYYLKPNLNMLELYKCVFKALSTLSFSNLCLALVFILILFGFRARVRVSCVCISILHLHGGNFLSNLYYTPRSHSSVSTLLLSFARTSIVFRIVPLSSCRMKEEERQNFTENATLHCHLLCVLDNP